MRTLLGILFGVIAAVAILAAVDWLDAALYPMPLEVDSADPATLAAIISDMPFAAKGLAVLAWLLAAFGGAWLALRVCNRPLAGWSVVALVIADAIASVLTLPHPLWMQVCAVVLPVVGGVLAARLHRKPYPGEALLG